MSTRRTATKRPRRTSDPTSEVRYPTIEATTPTVADGAAPAWRPPRRVISATAAARSFSDLITRVCYRGETYIVEKGGRPMCELSPVENDRFTGADFLVLLSTLPKPAKEFLDAVEDVTRHQATIEPSPWER